MSKKTEDLNFTKAIERLEEIVAKLEDPATDLEEGLSLLEEGVSLHKYCKNKLTEANTKITKILKVNSNQE